MIFLFTLIFYAIFYIAYGKDYFQNYYIFADPINFSLRVSISILKLKRNYNTSNFILPFQPKSYTNCKICDFHPNNKDFTPNSSQRDAILTIGKNRLVNLYLFVKTLRTTGSKCRFIVFLDDLAMTKYEVNFYKAVENCGVEFVNFKGLKRNIDIACIRFQIYADFLIANRFLFDRVYVCDLFDTVVQHDPFTTDFKNKLYISDEGIPLSHDSLNRYWISDCVKRMSEFSIFDDFHLDSNFENNISQFNILNSGLIAGSIYNMIEYCTVMGRMENKETFSLYAIYDQGFHNIVVYSGVLKGKADYVIESIESNMFSTIGVYITRTNEIERNNKTLSFGDIHIGKSVPGILHQFERSGRIKDLLMKSCPNEENFDDYVRN